MTRPKRKTASEGLATLIGQTITKIEGLENGSEKVSFITPSDTVTLEYFPDCCASCPLDDFDGDPNDLLGSPILLAEEVSNDPAKVSAEDIATLETLGFIAEEQDECFISFRFGSC